MNKKSLVFILSGIIFIISSIVEFIYDGKSLGILFLIIGIVSIITSIALKIKENTCIK